MKIYQLKTALILLLLVLGVTLNAQDKDAKDKLAELKGKVEKVTIKVDGRDVVFEGKEAERIAKLAKATGESKTFVFTTDDKGTHSGTVKLVEGVDLADKEFDVKVVPGAKKRVKIFKSGGDTKFDVIASDEIDLKTDGDQKKVKVEIKDGKKNITVTTVKDGKEETKTYEGEEAEKFLKEEGGNGKVKVFVKKIGEDDELEGDNVFYFNDNSNGGGCGCCCKSSCNRGGKKEVRIMHGGKGNMMWRMKSDDSDEKEVHVIVEKKKDLKESKETKKEEKK